MTRENKLALDQLKSTTTSQAYFNFFCQRNISIPTEAMQRNKKDKSRVFDLRLGSLGNVSL